MTAPFQGRRDRTLTKAAVAETENDDNNNDENNDVVELRKLADISAQPAGKVGATF